MLLRHAGGSHFIHVREKKNANIISSTRRHKKSRYTITLIYSCYTLSFMETLHYYARENSAIIVRVTPGSVYTRKNELEKKRAYEERVREVEHGSFSPLVFSAAGGMGTIATVVYKRLASLLAEKQGRSYSSTLHWLRCRLNFSLMRSAIMCIRGSRSTFSPFATPPTTEAIDLALHEGQVPSF